MDDEERRKRTRFQIESNDPELNKLILGHYFYLPPDRDWGRAGKGIRENEHIKELSLSSYPPNYVNRDELELFCGGIAGNKSIEQLKISCCGLFDGKIFRMLTPFVEQNNNIRCLRVGDGFGNAPMNCVPFLSESLSRFNTLKEFECNGTSLGDNKVEMLIRALMGHSSLIRVGLSKNKVGGRAMAALTALLTIPNSSLTDLLLPQCSINDEIAVILAATLGINTTLRKLRLAQNRDITNRGWRAIFTQLLSLRSSLEDLRLGGNSIDDNAANLLARSFANSTNLKALDISSNRNITNEGWEAFFNALSSPQCMLQELRLGGNQFDDEVVTHLANSLSNNCVLSNLDLVYNERVTPVGWRAFAAVLLNPNSALETVNLEGNSIDDDALISFATSLVHNSKLKELLLNGEEEDISAITNWGVLSNVLCNKTSINATFNSNHTLERILEPVMGSESLLPSDLQTLLQLNRESTEMEAARRKILKVHFGGDFNMQPFNDMDLKALPHAITWMARDEHGSSLLYQFVRNTTFFHDLNY